MRLGVVHAGAFGAAEPFASCVRVSWHDPARARQLMAPSSAKLVVDDADGPATTAGGARAEARAAAGGEA